MQCVSKTIHPDTTIYSMPRNKTTISSIKKHQETCNTPLLAYIIRVRQYDLRDIRISLCLYSQCPPLLAKGSSSELPFAYSESFQISLGHILIHRGKHAYKASNMDQKNFFSILCNLLLHKRSLALAGNASYFEYWISCTSSLACSNCCCSRSCF